MQQKDNVQQNFDAEMTGIIMPLIFIPAVQGLNIWQQNKKTEAPS